MGLKGEGQGSSSIISRLLVFRANLIEFDFTGEEFKILAICPSGHLISGHGPWPLFLGVGRVGTTVIDSSITVVVGTVVVVVVVVVVVGAAVVVVVVVVLVVVVVVGQFISSSGQS